jgi:hypothetical protein
MRLFLEDDEDSPEECPSSSDNRSAHEPDEDVNMPLPRLLPCRSLWNDVVDDKMKPLLHEVAKGIGRLDFTSFSSVSENISSKSMLDWDAQLEARIARRPTASSSYLEQYS